MSPLQDRERARSVGEVFDFMGKHGLALDDLIEIGGESLNSPNPKQVEKARRVDKCWALMARLLVKFADLEQAPPYHPAKATRRRRGEVVFSEVIENKDVSAIDTDEAKSLNNNNKSNNHSVEPGRWKHKRRLTPDSEGVAS